MLHSPARFNESLPAGYDGQFDWDFLRGAFGPVVMPMDFDGVVERHGRFLVFETKAEDAPIPVGQRRALEAAWKTGIFTILILWGKTPDTVQFASIWDENGAQVEAHPVDAQTIYGYAAYWWLEASNKPIPDSPWLLRSFLDQRDKEVDELKKALNGAHSKIDTLDRYIKKLAVPKNKAIKKAGRAQLEIFKPCLIAQASA